MAKQRTSMTKKKPPADKPKATWKERAETLVQDVVEVWERLLPQREPVMVPIPSYDPRRKRRYP